MSPTPKELEPQSFREPISLLFQEIREGRYPWLLESLKGKTLVGFLIDSSSPEGLCVHLFMGWSREGHSHLEVSCGDDFKKVVELNRHLGVEQAYTVNWDGVAGNKIYEQGKMTRTGLFILSPPSRVGQIPNFSFKKLEEGLLRAAGRLLE